MIGPGDVGARLFASWFAPFFARFLPHRILLLSLWWFVFGVLGVHVGP